MSEPKSQKQSSRQEWKRLLYLTLLGLILAPIVIVWIIFVYIDPEFGEEQYYHWVSRMADYPNWLKPQRPGFIYAQPLSPTGIGLAWRYEDRKDLSYFLISRAEGQPINYQIITKLPPDADRFANNGQELYGDPSLKPATTYFYRIQACKTFPFRCSEWSPPRAATTFQDRPEPPSDLEAVAVSPNEIELQWNYHCGNNLGFEIFMNQGEKLLCPDYRSDRAYDENTCPREKVGPNEAKWSKCGFAPGSVYTFRVSAFNEHYHSVYNPQVTVNTPPLNLPIPGRIGKSIKVPGMEEDDGGAALIWTGSEYALAWPSDRDDPGRSQRGEYRMWQIYFRRLGAQFEPLGSEIRISRGHGISESPSLAWSGSEYGLVWMDSRQAVYDCDGSEGCIVRRDLFFARISAQGQFAGSEVWIQDAHSYWLDPKLFWNSDHYDLFWNNGNQILFVKLSLAGEKLINSKVVVSTSNPRSFFIDYAVAANQPEYGIAWVDRNEPAFDLYFLHLDANSFKQSRPLKLSGCQEEQACGHSPDQAESASVFWTGNEFGVCWQNHFNYTVLSVIPAQGIAPIRRVDLNSFSLPKLCRETGLKPKLESDHI